MLNKKITMGAAMLTLFAVTTLAPVASRADGLQDNKNMFRNLAIGSAAIAGLGLIDHNSTMTFAGVAGAAIAGSQYEQDRQAQSIQQNDCNYYGGNTWNDGYRGDGDNRFKVNIYDREGRANDNRRGDNRNDRDNRDGRDGRNNGQDNQRGWNGDHR